jgi:hypothetical protein
MREGRLFGGGLFRFRQSGTLPEMLRTLSLLLLLAGTACREERPPAPTAEQSDQLNDAEAMLNEQAESSE